MKKKYSVEVTLYLLVEATDETEAFDAAHWVANKISDFEPAIDGWVIEDSIEEAN